MILMQIMILPQYLSNMDIQSKIKAKRNPLGDYNDGHSYAPNRRWIARKTFENQNFR